MDQIERAARQWQGLRPHMDVEALLVVGRVQRLWALWDERLRHTFAEAGLHPGDFDVLAALRRTDAPTLPGHLARSMLVTAGATTKRVERLVAAGLVERTDVTADGRQRPVQLTSHGVATADRLMSAHLADEEGLLAPLAPAERQQLANLLAALLTAVEPATEPESTPDDHH